MISGFNNSVIKIFNKIKDILKCLLGGKKKMSMDQKYWFFDQPVRYDELLAAFNGVATAFDERLVDMGWFGIAPNPWSPANQLDAGENTAPDMKVVVAAGRAYSKDGKRMIRKTATDKPDLSLDLNGASTIPTNPNERYVSLFILQDFSLSDDRIDGNGNPVRFDKELAFKFEVVAGTEAGVGLAVKPALRTDAVLLCDVLLDSASTQIVNAGTPASPVKDEIDKLRTENWAVSADSMLARVVRASETLDVNNNLGNTTLNATSAFHAEGVARAWAGVNGAGTTKNKYNCTVVRNSAGIYDITLPTGLFAAATDICPIATLEEVFATGYTIHVEPQSATVVRVWTWDGAAFADLDFYCVIFGRPSI